MLFRQNNICMGAALGSQYRAMTLAAEILIAQLHSQSKLTTAWHKNRKIRYKNELLKAKEPAPDV
jgi:dTDP-4-amino-4,6-dideoxygalactose transaminase